MSKILRNSSLVEKFILLSSAIYCLIFIGMLFLRPGTATSNKTFQNFYQFIPPLCAGVSHLLYAFRLLKEHSIRKTAHFIIGCGCLSWASGQFIWFYMESVLGIEAPFPSFSDLGYLGAYPFLILGVLLLFGLSEKTEKLRLFTDSAIVSSGIGILSWNFLVSGWWHSSKISNAGKLLSAAYPLADVAILFVALILFFSSINNKTSLLSSGFLSAGLSLIAVGDSLFSYYNLNELYQTGSWFDWTYSFGWICITYAALIPLRQKKIILNTSQNCSVSSMEHVSIVFNESHQFTKVQSLFAGIRLLLPYLLAFSAWALVASHDYHQDQLINTSTYISGFWLMSLVILRQVMMMLHNHHLTHRLQSLNLSLEHTVARRTHQIKSLFELTKAVNNSLQASQVLEKALVHTRECLNAQSVAIRLCESGNCAQTASVLEQGFANRIVALEWVKNLEMATEIELLEAPQDDINWLLMRAPLQWRETQLGDICVLRTRAEPFSQAEREMIESIGIEVAAAYRNAQIHAIAVEHADRDAMTGLLNHRAIQERLQTEIERAEKTKRPLAVIMMDLNNFKLFNDTYGHPVGDQVLKRVASALESKCRKLDVLGRYGGDEFIAVLPETDLPLAMVVAQRWRERMELEGFHFAGDRERVIPVSLSFGVATYPADSTNRLQLVSIADANLYAAKLSEKGIVGTSETQRQNRILKTESSFDVLDAMVTAVDNKDSYTRRHSEDVTEFALWIAEDMNLSKATQRVIRLAGLLHDVGKIGVPEAVLKKPGRLTNEEFDVMKGHAQFGAFIVGGVPDMEEIVPGVKYHHERWDGKGYPEGLAGEAIPFLGRLLAVADACSAMTTSRPYRQALDWGAAMKEIEANIGTQFDPEMAAAFLRVARKKRPELGAPNAASHLQLVEKPLKSLSA